MRGITRMNRFFHSLRFQLPAVLLGLFILILGLWVLLFREISSITGKTRTLNGSTEISDRVTEWSNHVATAARERTKFMTLSKEGYLEGFISAAESFESSYASIRDLSSLGYSHSLDRLKEYHVINAEYLTRAQAFAWEWRNSEKVKEELLARVVKPMPTEPSRAALKEPTSSKLTRKTRPGAKVGAKRGGSKIKREAKRPPNPEWLKAKAEKVQAQMGLESLERRNKVRDAKASDAFKALEGRLREGLQDIQAELRQERMDKQQSLRATITRAKHRLLYSMVLLTLMLAYVAYILQWKILGPLSLLENGAVQIGRGFLDFRVQVRSRSEIGDLADVFNTMADKLSRSRENDMRLKRLDAIQQLVRSVNHEINNPLMIISGNAEYLLTVLNNKDEGVKDKLETIVTEVRRIFLVTQQLKEIKELVTSNYTSDQDQMIDLARSSQVVRRAW